MLRELGDDRFGIQVVLSYTADLWMRPKKQVEYTMVTPVQADTQTGGSIISATVPDWSRESKRYFSWHPSRSLLASLRNYERWSRSTSLISGFMRRIAVLKHRFWSIVTGAEIPLGTRIGGGLLLLHPNGIVIHPDSTVGPNCLILQQVTLGVGTGGAPKIGGHVDIGAGAKVLGNVTVGDHAKIGANAVVLDDVPAYSTAVGVPARIVQGRAVRRLESEGAAAPEHV